MVAPQSDFASASLSNFHVLMRVHARVHNSMRSVRGMSRDSHPYPIRLHCQSRQNIPQYNNIVVSDSTKVMCFRPVVSIAVDQSIGLVFRTSQEDLPGRARWLKGAQSSTTVN